MNAALPGHFAALGRVPPMRPSPRGPLRGPGGPRGPTLVCRAGVRPATRMRKHRAEV